MLKINWPHIFTGSSTIYAFLQQINVKNVRPVYGAGIWTYDLLNMSRHL